MAPVCFFFFVAVVVFCSCPFPFHFKETSNESLHRATLPLSLSLSSYCCSGGNIIASRRRPPSAERMNRKPKIHTHSHTQKHTHMMGPKKLLLTLYASLLSISPLLPSPSLPPSLPRLRHILFRCLYTVKMMDGWRHTKQTHTQSQKEEGIRCNACLSHPLLPNFFSFSASRSPWS